MSRSLPSVSTLFDGILAGDRVMLGRALTLVESVKPEHRELAEELVFRILRETGAGADSFRVAVSGAPGVGKSTFIEALGLHLLDQGKKIAVLAIDPSSQISKGSILGDKTRMEMLSTREQAFIRPSPAGDSLGGVARKTKESILLVEAAGYDTVLIETVGVGQSEYAAQRMTDLFVLLLLPGAGDELQGIKRGIVEMADILLVNKSDGDRVKLANQARAYYLSAVHLLPPKESGYTPRVMACSAAEKTGISEFWEAAEEYRRQMQHKGYLAENRRHQSVYWFRESLQEMVLRRFFEDPGIVEALGDLEKAVAKGELSPFAAAEKMLTLSSGKS